MTLIKRKIAVNKSCEKLLLCLRYTFSSDWLRRKMGVVERLVTGRDNVVRGKTDPPF